MAIAGAPAARALRSKGFKSISRKDGFKGSRKTLMAFNKMKKAGRMGFGIAYTN